MKRISACLFLLLPCILFKATLLYAATQENARSELSSTTTAIAEHKKKQKKLEKQHQKIEQELKNLQKEMVKLAQNTGGEEAALSEFEEKLAILEEQRSVKKEELKNRKSELSSMISIMFSLKNIPKEAVIAMPGELDDVINTARSLSIISNAVTQEAASLNNQLIALDELEETIRKNRETILHRKVELSSKQQALLAKIKERTLLQNELGLQEKTEKEQLTQLLNKSRNLQELLDNLQKKQKEQDNHPIIAEEDETEVAESFTTNKKLHLPASGKIIHRYGNDGTEISHGITLKTRENATVVAPFGGQVVYAGNFRDYGKMVIIKHGNDYHTLLSGMEKINCTTGQLLLKGEPIGSMGETDEKTRLYMELRKNSKPVDPSPYL